MRKLAALIERKRIVLSDGAWGTEIAKRVTEPVTCPELLNAEAPDAIRDIASAYAAAGADVVLSNTFGGSAHKLERCGVVGRAGELNEAGIRLSVEGVSGRTLVVGSIGPTGEFLEPLGTITEAAMTGMFAEQVAAFVRGGVDAVLVETQSDLGEALCAIRAVRENSDLEVICSMTYDKGVRSFATMMGVTPERAAEALAEAGADVIGANCGSGIATMIELTGLLKAASGLPLWIKPNAGLPELIGGETVYRETPADMAARIPELVEAGATFVGGCCGTTPAHIEMFREAIDLLLVT